VEQAASSAPVEALRECAWTGEGCIDAWRAAQRRLGISDPRLDVVLITHPRDERDLARLFPWAENMDAAQVREATAQMRGDYAEVSQAGAFTVGIVFIPLFAADILSGSPGAALSVLVDQGLGAAARHGARYASLGGLTGALSMYGQAIRDEARSCGIEVGTGHSATAVSVVRTLERAATELDRPLRGGHLVLLGLGSVGAGVLRLLLGSGRIPDRITLIDRPGRGRRLERLRDEAAASCPTQIELTAGDGSLAPDSRAYDCDFLVSAISSSYVVDVARVRPGTILVDDSQPYCWSREEAWARCRDRGDIAPCEAGLIDCSSLGYASYLPFDFAAGTGDGTAWSCLAEAMMCAVDPTLVPTVGEPTLPNLLSYDEAFDRLDLAVAPLQCAPHLLPTGALRSRLRSAASIAA
jgi:predicted amino acid dehydrogenase